MWAKNKWLIRCIHLIAHFSFIWFRVKFALLLLCLLFFPVLCIAFWHCVLVLDSMLALFAPNLNDSDVTHCSVVLLRAPSVEQPCIVATLRMPVDRLANYMMTWLCVYTTIGWAPTREPMSMGNGSGMHAGMRMCARIVGTSRTCCLECLWQPRCLHNMAVVFYLPPRNYQFLALQTIVYWAIVAGHMASGYSLLIGIPLLPLLVVQITLLIHIWTSLVTRHQFHPVEPPSVSSASQSMNEVAPSQWVVRQVIRLHSFALEEDWSILYLRDFFTSFFFVYSKLISSEQ